MSRRGNDATSLTARTVQVPGGCWEWRGKILKSGYGEAWYKNRSMVAHRAIWLATGRTIPDGLNLDHLCSNKRCCNPAHLEPVTQSENVLRGWRRGRALTGKFAINAAKTHCHAGHELAGDNLYLWRGRRICRACRRARSAALKSPKQQGASA